MSKVVMFLFRMLALSAFEVVLVIVLWIDAKLSIQICFWIAIISAALRLSSVYRLRLRLALLDKTIFVIDYMPGCLLMIAATSIALMKGYMLEALIFGVHAVITSLIIREMSKFKKGAM